MAQNWLDIQHRGYRAYLDETEDQSACQRLFRAILPIPGISDKIETVLYDCLVDTQWLERIEAGLPYLEHAIKEGRQFILRQGDVVPVEKVRRVSRSSVEHLSRHSELITRLPEPNESPVPDKLYMTENIGTYAVYENRFLYLLLRELQDFLSYRYRRIREITETFSAQITLRREVNDRERHIAFHLTYQETDQTPEDLVTPQTRKTVARIANALQEVERLLKTPLMTEVAAAPLLVPPVTRTNVLLHNPNFVAAFALYAYLTEYDGDGFQTVERQRSEQDAHAQMLRETATLVSLTSYLSHRWSGLLDALEQRYAEEEALRREQADKAQKARLKELKARAGKSLEDALAYMTELERRNEDLETYADQIRAAKALHEQALERLEKAREIENELREQMAATNGLLASKERQIEQADRDMDQLRATVQALQTQDDSRLEALRQEYEDQIKHLQEAFLQEYEALAESLRIENARHHAKEGSDVDLSSREAFAELEAEYAAFRRFYRKQWNAAKRQIRQSHLGSQD